MRKSDGGHPPHRICADSYDSSRKRGVYYVSRLSPFTFATAARAPVAAGMDKYVRVEAAKPAVAAVPNEVRIMTDGKMRNYIKYATTLLLVRTLNTPPNFCPPPDGPAQEPRGRHVNPDCLLSVHPYTIAASILPGLSWEPRQWVCRRD